MLILILFLVILSALKEFIGMENMVTEMSESIPNTLFQ